MVGVVVGWSERLKRINQLEKGIEALKHSMKTFGIISSWLRKIRVG